MNIHLLPLVVLAIGIIFLVSYAALKDAPAQGAMWLWHTLILAFGIFALFLSGTKNPVPFLRGGLINDGVSHSLGVAVLAAALFIQIGRFSERRLISVHVSILCLCMAFFSLMAVQANRIFFTTLSVVAMMLSSQGALMNEAPKGQQPDLAMALVRRCFGFLIGCTLFLSLCILTFGETQIDEIQIHLSRVKDDLALVNVIQFIILFGAMFVASIPPVTGIFGRSRRKSSWSMSVLFTAMFSLVALQIFIKQGLFIFTRVSVGAIELEPQTGTQILYLTKWVAAMGLVLTPLLALGQKNIRQSLLLFIINPFVQILLALSFGTREIMTFAFGYIPETVVAISLLAVSSKALGLDNETDLKEWVGVGRRVPAQALIVMLSVWALAGFAPFYGGTLVQKTLCINSPFTYFLGLNIFFAGCYALRLSVLAFQKPITEKTGIVELHKVEKIFSFGQVILLIFMGIFWQPLYKYGAYSIRHLFGEF